MRRLPLLAFLAPAVLAGAPVPVAVDWASFLGRQDLTWNHPPEANGDAAFVGNGSLGAMVHMEGAGLAWEVNRTDVAHGGVRYRMGRLELHPPQMGFNAGSARLDLWNGELNGQLDTGSGVIQWRTFAARSPSVIVVELSGLRGELGAGLVWLADLARPPWKGPRPEVFPPSQLHPPPIVTTGVGIVTSVQSFIGGGAFAVVLRRIASEPGRRVYVLAIGSGRDGGPALAEAMSAVESAGNLGIKALVASNRAWWHAYLATGLLSVPDPRMEAFYWIQLYKLGCAVPAAGIVGEDLAPWYASGAFGRSDLASESKLAYRLLWTSNRLGLARNLYDDLNRTWGSPNAFQTRLEQGMPPGAVLAHVLMGQGDAADADLRVALDRSVLANTFFAGPRNGPLSDEGPLSLAVALQESLLQERNGTIRVFPAVPGSWKDAAFSHLRTESGFLVSAVRRDGKTAWVEIESPSGGSCHLTVNGWKSACVRAMEGEIGGLPISDRGGGEFDIGLPRAGRLLLAPTPAGPLEPLAPVDRPAAENNPYPGRFRETASPRAGTD